MKLTAKLPDGMIATRTTEHNYTHVVAVCRPGTANHVWASDWGALSWHKNEAAARKQISGRWGKIYPTHKIIAVDVPNRAMSRNERAAAFWGINLSAIPPQHVYPSL